MARVALRLLVVAALIIIVGCEKRPPVPVTVPATRLTLRAKADATSEQRAQALKMLTERLTRSKLPAKITQSGDAIFVDVAFSDDLDRVKSAIMGRGELTVRDETTKSDLVVIDRVAAARVERDPATKKGTLIVTLRPEDAAKVGALSQKLVGKKMTVALDGAAMARPLVQTAIPGDRLQIALPAIRDPATAEAEAAALVALLEVGTLPVPVEIALEERISMTK
jgi:preprotein translocase subunit SecD